MTININAVINLLIAMTMILRFHVVGNNFFVFITVLLMKIHIANIYFHYN